jgi:hypothetical protein
VDSNQINPTAVTDGSGGAIIAWQDKRGGNYDVYASRVLQSGSITSVENVGTVPTGFALSQNYPNPFNPSTRIQYTIESAGLVSLKVYDMLGREVATLVNGRQEAGTYTVQFGINSGASGLSSGIYFYRLKVGSFISTKKLVLMK